MRHLPALLPFVTLLLASPPARADEIQVPLDELGQVQEVKAERARAWGILTDYPELTEGRLYQDTASGAYTLEVTEDRDGRSVRRRVSLSDDSVVSLRRQVSAGLAKHLVPPNRFLNQEGRWVLVALSTAVGASYYGVALSSLPTLFNAINPYSTTYGLYTLTVAASFFVPLFATMNREVTWGTTAAFYAGITRGIGHGLLLGKSVLPLSALSSSQPLLLFGTVVGLAEGIGAAYWAAKRGIGAGLAHSAMTGTDFGAAYGLGLYALLGGSDAMHEPWLRWTAASALVGSIGGTVGAYLWSQNRGYTWGAAEAIRTSGLLGAFATVPVLAWTNATDVRVLSGVMLAGSAVGLVVGDRLFADRNYGAGEGLLLDLGVAAGGLLGLGAAALGGTMTYAPAPVYTLAALGAVGGYVLTYCVLPSAPFGQRAEAPAVRLHVDPVALATQLPGTAQVFGPSGLGGSGSAIGAGASLGPAIAPPAVSLAGGF